ncbi:MAG: OsmC family protein [Candidatus Sulfotelmatobacter sp.]|jgi:organic hydroperoxide reductase OsmC/OhrA
MEDEHKHHVIAWWSAGQSGIAKSDSAPHAIHFAAPPEFGGPEGRWTPEDFLLSALASCFTTTFHTLAGYSKFEFTDLEVEAEGTICKSDAGYNFSRIFLRPRLTISGEEKRERALGLLRKAEELCLVSRALSTTPKVEARVEVRKSSPA